LRDAAERRLAGFELMGDAEAWIADLWTREVHECVRVRTYPYTASGLMAWLADVLAWGRWRLRRRAL
jgi:hypothetical protein